MRFYEFLNLFCPDSIIVNINIENKIELLFARTNLIASYFICIQSNANHRKNISDYYYNNYKKLI